MQKIDCKFKIKDLVKIKTSAYHGVMGFVSRITYVKNNIYYLSINGLSHSFYGDELELLDSNIKCRK
jgi:hypothetical protein